MCGPVVREGAKEAMLALRYEAHHRGPRRRSQNGAAT